MDDSVRIYLDGRRWARAYFNIYIYHIIIGRTCRAAAITHTHTEKNVENAFENDEKFCA